MNLALQPFQSLCVYKRVVSQAGSPSMLISQLTGWENCGAERVKLTTTQRIQQEFLPGARSEHRYLYRCSLTFGLDFSSLLTY